MSEVDKSFDKFSTEGTSAIPRFVVSRKTKKKSTEILTVTQFIAVS